MLCLNRDIPGPFWRRSLRGGATALLHHAIGCPATPRACTGRFRAKNGSSFTVYGGDRFAGSVRDSATGLHHQSAEWFELCPALDIGLDRNNQVEVFYSQQNSALSSARFHRRRTISD